VSSDRWDLRTVPAALADAYKRDGHWTDQTLGEMVAVGLAGKSNVAFEVHSQVHPFKGTFADIDRAARSLAASLRATGVGPGDVAVLQLPNWAEAGIAFWAAAYVGAVVVPIVHFYGAKEVGYILRATQPDVVVTVDRFGQSDYLALYEDLLTGYSDARWLVAAAADVALPARATRFESLLDADPLTSPGTVDPDAPAVIGFTSGTTRDPKGVVHSSRTMGCETRHIDWMMPPGPPQITAAPVGHFIGMLNAFLVPLLRERAVHLVDVWDPGAVLALMKDAGLNMGGGATYFLTSLLDHPDFDETHAALMPYAGLGGSPVPVAVMERAARLGITAWRAYGSTEHPSITGCNFEDPEDKRHTTDGRAMPGVEFRLDDEGQILSRGPDLFLGYTDAELTASVFDDDGWYRTGDVGVVDDDGYLAITDRVSDVIIRGGENISAAEVEELLMGLDAIAEVAVVAEPDARFGERAAAVLRLKPDRNAPSLDEVRAHLAAAGLAKQKWPEALYTVADLPRTPSGKIQKFVLRRHLRDGGVSHN
jgi:acyl-CoA synthetase